MYAPTKPVLVAPPAAGRAPLVSMLVTFTSRPVWVQVPFQLPLMLCQVVGQVNVRVQPLIGDGPVLVMSMLPT